MIESACRLRGHPLTPEAMPPLLERLVAFYTATMPGDSKPFPGVIAAMDALKANGFKLEMVVRWSLLAVALVTAKTFVSSAFDAGNTVTPELASAFWSAGMAVVMRRPAG